MNKFIITLFIAQSFLWSQQLGLPKYSSSDQIISHFAYTLKYDENHEQAAWVAYQLSSAHTSGNVSRTNDFRPDYSVKTGSAGLSDYKGSGYDRGHLA
ncbi:MAG: DNA/RNA non-specific endonuclease, partial [FCB group bacterium]|nr:DNA/RNA non-specific endonuclease [FCB group bacterium]